MCVAPLLTQAASPELYQRTGMQMTTSDARPSPLKTAITCQCPRCGKAPLFKQLLNMRDGCTHCGLDYKFVDTGDGPAVFVIFLLGIVILGGALFVEFTYYPPPWVHFVLWGFLTPALAILFLRFMKAGLIALQFKHQAEEGRLADDHDKV